MTRHAVITGAFSNSGSAVADALLARGWSVATLTNREPRGPHAAQIASHALRFSQEHLTTALAGADVVVNTYWVRFAHADVSFETAIENTRILIDAAHAAGVRRFVQFSVSNASLDSPLGYYAGKARVEQLVRASGMRYAIVRPTLIVGPRDVLSNNIAWFLRRLPVIALPSGAGYRLSPLTLTDTGRLVADAVEAETDIEWELAGPDTWTFREYVGLLAEAIGRHPRYVTVPPRVMVGALRLLSPLLRDTVLTREELEGLHNNMLLASEPPRGTESVASWIAEYGHLFGRSYVNDTTTRFHHPAH